MTKKDLLERLAVALTPGARARMQDKVVQAVLSHHISVSKAVRGMTDTELVFCAQRITDLRILGELRRALTGPKTRYNCVDTVPRERVSWPDRGTVCVPKEEQ